MQTRSGGGREERGLRACARLHSNKKTFGEEMAVKVLVIQVRPGHPSSHFYGSPAPWTNPRRALISPGTPRSLLRLVPTRTDRQIHFTRAASGGSAVWTNHLARSCKVTRTAADEELRLKSLIQSCSRELKIHSKPLKSYRKWHRGGHTGVFCVVFFFPHNK